MLQIFIVTNKQKSLLGCSLHLLRSNAHVHVLGLLRRMLSPLLSFCLYFMRCITVCIAKDTMLLAAIGTVK